MAVRIVILAKAPLPGYAKTRLIPALGEQGAANLAVQLLHHTLREALHADVGEVELCVAPTLDHTIWAQYHFPGLIWSEQSEGDLGERMLQIAARVTQKSEAVILMGTDCPELTSQRLRDAARALQYYDTCLFPVIDGGYALLGLSRFVPSVFCDIPWSTDQVGELTRQRVHSAGCSMKEFETLRDVDTPEDLFWVRQ